MPNIFHQSVEDILKAATPEQRLLWNYLFLRFGERISISQFVFGGASAGSELLIYSANKLYVAYQFNYNGLSAVGVNGAQVQFMDETNAVKYELTNNAPVWDTTAAAMRYAPNSASINNIWFSRCAPFTASRIQFIGYRIGI